MRLNNICSRLTLMFHLFFFLFLFSFLLLPNALLFSHFISYLRYALHPENAIPCEPWFAEDPTDCELERLLPFLEALRVRCYVSHFRFWFLLIGLTPPTLFPLYASTVAIFAPCFRSGLINVYKTKFTSTTTQIPSVATFQGWEAPRRGAGAEVEDSVVCNQYRVGGLRGGKMMRVTMTRKWRFRRRFLLRHPQDQGVPLKFPSIWMIDHIS